MEKNKPFVDGIQEGKRLISSFQNFSYIRRRLGDKNFDIFIRKKLEIFWGVKFKGK